MPQRPTAFVVGAVAIIVALLAVAAFANLQANDTSAHVARSLATSDVAERLLGTIRDAETGQRGYLLTGDESYLEPYTSGRATVEDAYQRLVGLVDGRPKQMDRVAGLKAPIESKMAELAETVQMAQAGDHNGALAVTVQGTGKVLMDDIRARVQDIEAAETMARQMLGDAESQRRLVVLIAFVVAILGLIALGWWLLRVGHIRTVALSVENADLEGRVAERTAALQKEQSRVELLLHDMNHRVGNNLSVIAAILGMQRRQSSDPEVKSALAAAEERIAAIGATQRRMRLNLDSDEVDGRQFFADLADDLRHACAGRPIAIVTEIDDVRLPGREAVTYGVLVNELMTNSVKHAFPNGSRGTISLSVKMLGPGSMAVEVADDGVGVSQDGQGLGTTILTNLARSLGAQVEVSPAAAGTPRPGLKTRFTVNNTQIAASA